MQTIQVLARWVRRNWRFVALVVGLCLILALLLGCRGAVERIEIGARTISAEAVAAKQDLQSARDTGDVGPAAAPHIDSADKRLGAIKDSAAQVQAAVPHVENRASAWVVVARRVSMFLVIAAALGGTGYLLWNTGIGVTLRAFLSRLSPWLASVLIPAPVKSAAKLDAEATEAGGASESQQRVITARRTAEPLYAAAFETQKRSAKRARAGVPGARFGPIS